MIKQKLTITITRMISITRMSLIMSDADCTSGREPRSVAAS